jgi:nicotinate-nucleotide adenylyltransferase
MTQPIGILGGTFDPVHNGHLHLATTFLKELDLAELRFIPLNNPPHRPAPLASPEQRLQMLKLAVENHSLLKVDDCELQRDEVSYTIDTLKLLRKEIGDTPLCMLIGADNFKTLNSWHQWQSLLNYTHIVIANRPGSDEQRGNDRLDDEMQECMDSHMTRSVTDLHQQSSGCIMKLDIPMLDISSTQIRTFFQSGPQSSLKSESLLPEKVLDFIQTHNLYKN